MISNITDICMVFLQYGFSHALSDYYHEQMFSDITDTCIVSRQYGFSIAQCMKLSTSVLISDITDICMMSYSMFSHASCQISP